MSKDVLTYKGYSTRPEYSIEDGVIFGKIEGISDLVSFECDSTAPEDVEAAFREAVDDYLEACRAVGKEPNKSYKGSFNVRIDPVLHRKLNECAYQDGESMNHMLENILRWYFSSAGISKQGEEVAYANSYSDTPSFVWDLIGVANSDAFRSIQDGFAKSSLFQKGA